MSIHPAQPVPLGLRNSFPMPGLQLDSASQPHQVSDRFLWSGFLPHGVSQHVSGSCTVIIKWLVRKIIFLNS